ncbi:MAG: GDSL-type esterase/lipase family protein [Fibrobacteria bacterium]
MKNTKRFLSCMGIAGGLVAWTAATPTRIVIIGDSTVQTYDSARYYPQEGWGQELKHYFQPGTVTIDNRAIAARSTRSFYEEGRWAGIVPTLKAGDFVFIQFGHNDRGGDATRYADTSTYKSFLGKYVTESRAKGAIPVLVTPMNQNTWSGSTLTEGFNVGAKNYRGAMMSVATAMNVPLIDLEQGSKEVFQALGQDYNAKFLFLGLAKGEYPAHPNGAADATHFQLMGALEMARCVAARLGSSTHEGLQPLAQSLAPLYAFEPALNKAGAATITQPSSYPAGAPLILKAIVKSGETFEGWKDASGLVLSRETSYRTKMPAGPFKVWASFNGGVVGLMAQKHAPVRAAAPERDALGRNLVDPAVRYFGFPLFQ